MSWLCGNCQHYKNLDCKIGMNNCTKLSKIFKNWDKRIKALEQGYPNKKELERMNVYEGND